MDSLPKTGQLAVLHANPAATHTFVNPLTGEYTGTIDFGDAYISHPVFDLRRWSLEDRQYLFEGYVSQQPVNEDFKRIWDVIWIADKMNELSNVQQLSSELEKLL